MAVTANKIIEVKEGSNAKSINFPVKSGETIYKGVISFVEAAEGLLKNLPATTALVGIACIAEDDSANITGPAATTAAGSISGDLEEGSPVAGDKTVRKCYTKGIFKLPLASAAQIDVGKAVYAVDNYTLSLTSTDNQWLGTIVAVIGTTHVYVDLNESYAI